MRTTLFFARKYLLEKKRSTISVIIGIAIGVAILLSFLCLTNGYRQSLVNRILGATSHMKVMTMQGSPIFNYKRVEKKISDTEGVTQTSPLLVKKGLIKKRNRSLDVRLLGIKNAKQISKIIRGSSGELKKGKVIIGAKLAKKLGGYPGDNVEIIFSSGQRKKLEIGAVFDAGLSQFNSKIAYISFEKAQKIFKMKNQATLIQVQVRDPFAIKAITKKIKTKTGYYIVNWKQENKNLFSAMAIEKRLFTIILVFMLIIAGFGIANVLNMLVLEKERDIGILKAIGTPKKVIRKIFLLQGLIMGGIGIFIGVIIGLIITLILSKYPIKISTDVYNVEYLKIQLEWSQFMIVGGVTLLITSLASIYPAHKATKLEAIEVLRE